MRSGALRPCCVAPGTTPHTICLSVSLFYVLNGERDALAAADAHGDEAVAATSAGKLVDGFGHQDRARGADGMTERDSAAVRIGALRGKAKLARHRTRPSRSPWRGRGDRSADQGYGESRHNSRRNEPKSCVPAEAKASLDIRLPVGISAEDINKRINDLIAPMANVEFRILTRHDPTHSDPRRGAIRVSREERCRGNRGSTSCEHARRRIRYTTVPGAGNSQRSVWLHATQHGRSKRIRHARGSANRLSGSCPDGF